VHAARKEDRRLSAALLAAALAHTPEAEEALRGARTRMARKPAALARELLRNFPKGRRGKGRRNKRRGPGAEAPTPGTAEPAEAVTLDDVETTEDESLDAVEAESPADDTPTDEEHDEHEAEAAA
jgi:hypothetical protein